MLIQEKLMKSWVGKHPKVSRKCAMMPGVGNPIIHMDIGNNRVAQLNTFASEYLSAKQANCIR
jgi:hypothetical protein